jgi:NADH:ubiquinone oxidoreductase subunit C
MFNNILIRKIIVGHKYFMYNLNLLATVCMIYLEKFQISKLFFFFRFSIFFFNLALLDIVCYTMSRLNKKVVLYSFKSVSSYFYVVLSTGSSRVKSIEFFFKNASWLEREVSDFFNIFFVNKRDRRTLFSIPLIYNAPLLKTFPVNGFYEIFLCFFLKKLKFRHVSIKN